MDGRVLKHGTGLRAVCGETSLLEDSAAKAELFLFQGQKGEPGLSPGKAHDGTKVGFQGPQSSGKQGSGEWGTPRGSPPRWLLDQGREVRKSAQISAGLAFSLEVLLPLPTPKPKPCPAVFFWVALDKTHRRFGQRTFLVSVLLTNALHGFL